MVKGQVIINSKQAAGITNRTDHGYRGLVTGQLCEQQNILLFENNDEDIVEAAHVSIVHVSMEPPVNISN